MDERSGAAVTALAADDEEEAFEMMAANCKEMGKWKGRKTKTTCQNKFPTGKILILESCLQPHNGTTSQFTSKTENGNLKSFSESLTLRFTYMDYTNNG